MPEMTPQTAPEYFHADGRPKSLQEVRDARAEAQYAKDRVAAELRARNRRDPTEDERSIRAFDKLIELRTEDARYLVHPEAKLNAREFINELKAKKQAILDKQAEEKRVERLQQSRPAQLVKEYATTLVRSPIPGCTAEQIAVAIALAERTDCEPDELARDFWAEIEKLETIGVNATQATANKAREDAARAEYHSALADVAAGEAALRLHQAQGATDGE
ncbi:hypothetical protein [Anatilimnocola floriformis]|uniref:hypothetical protein n=1 Tax=Anatilimnocola floriformis TaxID=2948575 RepID=UPI0020C47542|nr:hypothetical protein [Anatilimnocola floriformis]